MDEKSKCGNCILVGEGRVGEAVSWGETDPDLFKEAMDTIDRRDSGLLSCRLPVLLAEFARWIWTLEPLTKPSVVFARFRVVRGLALVGGNSCVWSSLFCAQEQDKP